MQLKDEVRQRILELSSESEYGSWEFWSASTGKTEEEASIIIQSIIDLVQEKKIIPVEYRSVKDQTYEEVPLDIARLEREVHDSMDNQVDRESFYWFLATDTGKKEDLVLRGQG